MALARSVDELLDSISYEELLRWGLFFEHEGFSEYRADVRAAQVCTILANANRDSKRRAEPFELIDFMPFVRRDQKEAEQRKAQREAEAKAQEAIEAASASAKEQERGGAEISPLTIAWLFKAAAKTAEKKASESSADKE